MAINYTKQKGFKPGRGYTRKDWDEVSDNPPLTKEEMDTARPFSEVFPGMAKAMEQEIAKRGRPRVDRPKKLVSLRLDQDVIDKFEATGKGWRARINEILRRVDPSA